MSDITINPPHNYEDSLDSFASADQLEKYRAGLWNKTALELAFIRREIGRHNLRVLELGGGSGRLLIGLAHEGIAQSGIGVELSPSRVNFARAWAADLGLDNIQFIQGDALDPGSWLTGQGRFDLIIGISNILGYIRPIRREAPAELLRALYASLAPGGCILLEFYQLGERRRQILALSDNRFRTWMPLPSWDPFAYYLSDFTYDPPASILHHKKTFIGRDGTIDEGRVETNSFQTRDEVLAWLESHSITNVIHRSFSSYASTPHNHDSTQVIMILGAPDWNPPQAEPVADLPPEKAPRDGPGAWV